MHTSPASMRALVAGTLLLAPATAFLPAGPLRLSGSPPRTLVQVEAATAAAGVTTTTTGYWDQEHPEVPPAILEQIRERPCRGVFEPQVDHELTEIPKASITGKVPKQLEGTLFRNGPGRIRTGDKKLGHWFDGDGYISKVVFSGGRAWAQGRYVRTTVFDEGSAVAEGGGDLKTRRPWTNAGGGVFANMGKEPENVANVGVREIGGRLFAVSEAGKPMELDPVTLETLSQGEDFDGGLSGTYSAHGSVDPETGDVFNFGFGPTRDVEITKMNKDGEVVKSHTFRPEGGLYFWHDTALTSEHLVGITPPFGVPLVGLFRSLLGFTPIGQEFAWLPKDTASMWFFSRDSLELVHKVELDSDPQMSTFHFVNAWREGGAGEGGQGEGAKTVVLLARLRGEREAVEAVYKDMYGVKMGPDNNCDLWRYEFDAEGGKLLSAGPVEAEGSLAMELPTIDLKAVSKPNRYVFVNGMSPGAGLLSNIQSLDLSAGEGKLQWKTHDFGPDRYAGEPVFVPRSPDAAEGDGFLVTTVYDTSAHVSEVVVLNAQDVAGKPVCTVRLPWHFPKDFHGMWSAKGHLPADA